MVKIASPLECELSIGLEPVAPAANPKRGSKVNYSDTTSRPSPILNDKSR